MNLPLLRMYPIYPGQWGVSGSDNELGIRSFAGGYISGANDMWVGNIAEDTAEAEVGDNGITIAIPAA